MLRNIIPPQPNGTNKNFVRFWFMLKLIKYAVIVVCMTLLPVCQYTYTTEDDFTPAYSSKSSATPATPVAPTTAPPTGTTTAPPTGTTTAPPTGITTAPHNVTTTAPPTGTTTAPPTGTTTAPPTGTTTAPPNVTTTAPPNGTITAPHTEQNTTNPPNKRSVRTLAETFARLPPERVDLYWVTSSMMFRERRDLQNKTGLKDDGKSSTQLSDFLVMYPCCTTILVIVGMEMCGQILLDPMTKWTCLFLIVLCIGLSIVIFTMSLLAALRATVAIMIVIAVLSMLFLILEIVDFVFVFNS